MSDFPPDQITALQARLAESEKRLELVQRMVDVTQELTHVGGWEWDIGAATMTWTRETYRIHDLDPDSIQPGSPLHIDQSLACYAEEDRERIQEAFQRCVHEGIPYDLECRFTSIAGKQLWIRTMAQAELLDDRIVRVIGNIIDITPHKTAQDALERSEQRYRNLASNMPGIVFRFSVKPDGSRQIEFATDRITSMFGIAMENGMQNVLLDAISSCHPEDRPRFIESINEAIASKESWHYEGRFRDPTGTVRWMQGDSNPRMRGDDLVYEGILIEITERKEAELALQESEHKFRSLMEQAVEMLFLHDLEGNLIDVNRASVENTGYSKQELLSMNVLDIDPDADTRDDPTVYWKVLQPGEAPVTFEVRHRRKDGSIYPAEVTLTKVALADGQLLFALARDISERKQAEQALRESEQNYRSLTETTIDWVFQIDRDGIYTYASPNVHSILGYSVQEVVGKTAYEFMPPSEAARMQLLFVEAASGKQRLIAVENTLINSDGEPVHIETNAVPLLDERDNLTGYFGTCRDITNRRQAEEAVRRSEEDLLRAQQVAHVGSWRFDLDRGLVIASEEARRIYGLGETEWSIAQVQKIPLPEYRQALDTAMKRLREHNEPYDIQFRIRRPSDGAVRMIHSLAEYEPDLNLVIGTIQDITDRVEAEQALRESEDLLRTIAASFPNSYLAVIDRGLTISYTAGQEFNNRNLDSAAYSGLSITSYLDNESPEVTEAIMQTFRGEPSQFEIQIHKQDLLCRTVPLFAKDRSINQIFVVAENISTQKQLARNRELQLQRRQLQAEVLTAVASSHNLTQGNIAALAYEITEAAARALQTDWVGIWLFSDDGTRLDNIDHFIKSSQTHSRRKALLEKDLPEKFNTIRQSKYIDVNEVLSDPRTSMYREDYLEPNQITSLLDAVIQAGGKTLGTLSFEHINHAHDWQEDEVNFACQLADQLALALANRERRKVEADRERLTKAIEQSGEIFMITDASSEILYVNAAFEQTTGYTRSEILGETPCLLKSGKQDAAFYREMWKILTAGKTWEGRLVNRKKNGELYTESATISQVLNADGKIEHYIAVMRDITEQLRLEREKERIEEQYRQTQRVEAVGRLAGGVAHDLNNLLTPILLYAEMLLEEMTDEDERTASVQEIFEAGTRARNLVTQLLAFSRKQNLEYTLVDLNRTVRNFSRLLRRTIREDIQIVADPGPVDRYIRADEGQIEQVIMNLAVNAQDAMPSGGELTLRTRLVALDQTFTKEIHEMEPGNYVLLEVADTGVGMDEKIQQRIFEPFFSTKGESGTGLGLATVYGIVKQHGGSIWVESEPGVGSTFTVYLPADREIDSDSEPQQEKPSRRTGSETILLVEDNAQVRKITCSILERQGYRILNAENGHKALELLKQHAGQVHLLLTDVVMPEMNGRQLYQQAVEIQPHLKVLYMSGYTDDVIAYQGILEEGISFIQKPFSVEALADSVRSAIEKAGPEDQIEENS